jgi:hypothetical protein
MVNSLTDLSFLALSKAQKGEAPYSRGVQATTV